MKTNQTDELKRAKTDDKTNQKPATADNKKGANKNVTFTKNGLPAKDVLGMDEQEEETPADKIHGKTQSPKTESKTGKNNLKKGGL